jgi:hypothetical protein
VKKIDSAPVIDLEKIKNAEKKKTFGSANTANLFSIPSKGYKDANM